MLTEEQIDNIQEAAYLKLRAEGYTGSMGGFKWDRTSARAIESAVRAEYADVPPEKFNGLYRAIQPVVDYAGAYGSIEARGDRMQAVMDALYSIDNGAYNPKIGGEE